MIGAFEVLIRPYCAFVDVRQAFGVKIVRIRIPVVFQDDQGVFVDMRMDLAFRFDNYLFKRIRKPEYGF